MTIHWKHPTFISHVQHRSGWRLVVENLKNCCLLPDHDILIDTYLDHTYQNNIFDPIYTCPWIGFIHHTNSGPITSSVHWLLLNNNFQQSLKNCLGLLVFSEDLAKYIRTKICVPVTVMTHPTDSSCCLFSMGNFVSNTDKQLLIIGDHLRVPNAAYKLFTKTKSYNRICHLRSNDNSRTRWLSDNEYDLLLSRNICFLKLYDASAVNVVIECITRCTPIIVNRLPALEEYLGVYYPLFYEKNNLAMARLLLNDISLISSAHVYLKSLNKDRLSFNYFVNHFNDILKEFITYLPNRINLVFDPVPILSILPTEINDLISGYLTSQSDLNNLRPYISDYAFTTQSKITRELESRSCGYRSQ